MRGFARWQPEPRHGGAAVSTQTAHTGEQRQSRHRWAGTRPLGIHPENFLEASACLPEHGEAACTLQTPQRAVPTGVPCQAPQDFPGTCVTRWPS